MKRREFIRALGVATATMYTGGALASEGNATRRDERPTNIVYIMSDELAYYELSLMGNPRIHTPRIDRMAAEGMRFTRALAGAPVCAPLRCTLMTGKHTGHSSVRANDGGTPLRSEEETIASMLKEIGYATGGFGKWGCGGRDSTGVPEKHGFDVFFGYYDQVHAHSYYPAYLIRNSEEVELAGNEGGRTGQTYSHYAIMDEALAFIRANEDQPFFCYLPITPPHGLYDIPADDPAWNLYRDDDWVKDPEVSQDAKNYAAMVSMVATECTPRTANRSVRSTPVYSWVPSLGCSAVMVTRSIPSMSATVRVEGTSTVPFTSRPPVPSAAIVVVVSSAVIVVVSEPPHAPANTTTAASTAIASNGRKRWVRGSIVCSPCRSFLVLVACSPCD